MGLPTNDYLRIISKSYGPRKPLVVCEASSLDMLANLDCAEGSTATVGGTEYVLDRVNGWIEPGSGGGGSGVLVVGVTFDEETGAVTLDKTWQEIYDASRRSVVILPSPEGGQGSVVSLLTGCAIGSASPTFAIPWRVMFITFDQNTPSSTTFSVDSPDGYPSMTEPTATEG